MTSNRTASHQPTIVIVGAGSVEFTRELLGDILSFPELSAARIILHDIDVDRLATSEMIARATARAAGATPEIHTATDRRRALDGADYVINTIQVGMLEATERDFDIPARYGLNQTIGDTIGIGGIFRGLRTFPVLAGIAEDMTQVCPDAWLLNYTNPMAMNVTFLHAVAPKLKVLGLCHSVYWTIRGLSELVGGTTGRGVLLVGRCQSSGVGAGSASMHASGRALGPGGPSCRTRGHRPRGILLRRPTLGLHHRPDSHRGRGTDASRGPAAIPLRGCGVRRRGATIVDHRSHPQNQISARPARHPESRRHSVT